MRQSVGANKLMIGLISRSEAFKVLNDFYHHKTEMQHASLKEALNRVPNAESKWGKWLNLRLFPDDITGNIHGECSLCGKIRIVDNYCPSCGAEMTIPEEEIQKAWDR